MKTPEKFPLRISDTMKVWVYNRKKMMEITHHVGDKAYVSCISGDRFKYLKKLMAIAGLPPAAVKAQMAVKRLIRNRDKWTPDQWLWENKPDLAQWLHDMEQELVAAHNALAEFNTENQKKNMDIISNIEKKAN